MTTCDIEILYFPFDMQACQIELGIANNEFTAYMQICCTARVRQSNSKFKLL